MPPASVLSDDSIPTSAHALQLRNTQLLQRINGNEQRMRQIQNEGKKYAWVALISLALSSGLIGFNLGLHFFQWLAERRIRREEQARKETSGNSHKEQEVTQQLIEDDEIAMIAAGLRRKQKHRIKRSDDLTVVEPTDLLASPDFFELLENTYVD